MLAVLIKIRKQYFSLPGHNLRLRVRSHVQAQQKRPCGHHRANLRTVEIHPKKALPLSKSTQRWIPLLLGPTAGICVAAILSLQSESAVEPMSGAALTLAVGTWMAFWWITEAVSLAKTATIPLVVFPLLAVRRAPGRRDCAILRASDNFSFL